MQKQEVKYPSQFIKLPSKGLVYPRDSVYSNGQIQLRYPTAQDQNILTSRPLIQKGTVLDVFIQNLVVNQAVNINQLILGDKNACLIASRILAYGSDYITKFKCPSCNKQQQYSFNLNTIINREIDVSMYQPGVNRFQVILPTTKKKITFKLLTGAEDNQISNIVKNQKNIGGVDTELTTRLRHSIVAVDGVQDKLQINKFVRIMPSRDSLALRNAIRQIMPDIQLNTKFSCNSCGYEQEIKFPINYDFFYPTR